MNRQAIVLLTSAVFGVVCAAIAAAFGATIYVSLPIFVGCLAGGMAVAYMKKS